MEKCKDIAGEYGAIRANGYKCPNCGKYEDRDEYFVDGEQYPKFFNERKGWSGEQYWDWDELHSCECGTKYFFENGAY